MMRPPRSAAQRREQYRRAQARVVQHMLRDFAALRHRGCRSTLLGRALEQALSTSPHASADVRKEPTKDCWHFSAGFCKRGASCGFGHQVRSSDSQDEAPAASCSSQAKPKTDSRCDMRAEAPEFVMPQAPVTHDTAAKAERTCSTMAAASRSTPSTTPACEGHRDTTDTARLRKTCSQVEAMDMDTAMMKFAEKKPLKFSNDFIIASAKAGKVHLAMDAVSAMKKANTQPDASTYTALISACVRTEKVHEALQLLAEIKESGQQPQPDVTIYNDVILACGRAQMPQHAQETFRSIVQSGLAPDEHSFHFLISALLQNGLVPDLCTFNGCIIACAAAQKSDEALEMFSCMGQNGVQPDEVTYTALILACGEAQPHKAWDLYVDMKHSSMRPHAAGYQTVLRICEQALWHERALEVIADMDQAGDSIK
eukprot:TRINITY_DN16892_c2_g1_i1.p1 TRINITY_DN16892_c2_g1~~TRINITY_DN16892_c2_g1_i1.p1  ORF type:complete len:427 (-),score=95.42 TRINITY_DN16892_c2_g1_i1:196-1476(-)